MAPFGEIMSSSVYPFFPLFLSSFLLLFVSLLFVAAFRLWSVPVPMMWMSQCMSDVGSAVSVTADICVVNCSVQKYFS